jgi:hypothetical protein
MSSSLPTPSSKQTATNVVRPSLSLLNGSPLPEDRGSPFAAETTNVKAFEIPNAVNSPKKQDPYIDLIDQAHQWKREMETIRDDIYFLQVQCAADLDNLHMAGAEIAN